MSLGYAQAHGGLEFVLPDDSKPHFAHFILEAVGEQDKVLSDNQTSTIHHRSSNFPFRRFTPFHRAPSSGDADDSGLHFLRSDREESEFRHWQDAAKDAG